MVATSHKQNPPSKLLSTDYVNSVLVNNIFLSQALYSEFWCSSKMLSMVFQRKGIKLL